MSGRPSSTFSMRSWGRRWPSRACFDYGRRGVMAAPTHLSELVMGYRVVVAGATGNVGREMLNILAEREFPADEIAVVASSRSQGDIVDFGDTGKKLKVQNIEHFDWRGWDMALFAIGSEATKIHAPIAAAA